jgi:molybdopterin molybdotransferase
VPGRRQYVRASFEVTPRGATVTPVGGHGSHLVGDLAVANALLVVAEEATGLEAGATAGVLVLDRDF